ncbi:hypothetical protein [Cryptosporidium parvum Iowa II]|uniref:Uncharacterized protein n=1 Tax=Cryptosporidium parvum (strain Iowa II) TaxID=353152 RepID=Q5CYL6_CRYPI|nr:hypothetical protein [Cryptosporidium parvum Iowa II]EAK90227.1 hypothetical protein cgd7_1870 [Cryptosporidium parvum Iowa II]WKS78874.1 hypothetical protein CPCDC_7g1870 [Cryptosporidium sp. 43IA8]
MVFSTTHIKLLILYFFFPLRYPQNETRSQKNKNVRRPSTFIQRQHIWTNSVRGNFSRRSKLKNQGSKVLNFSNYNKKFLIHIIRENGKFYEVRSFPFNGSDDI